MGWTELPAGHDIVLKAGYSYSAIARVKKSHTRETVLGLLASRGLKILTFDDPLTGPQCPNTSDNYRCVGATVMATRDAGSIPWSSPVPIFDETGLVKAWYAGPGQLPQGAPSSSGSGATTALVVGGVAAGLAGIWWWLKKHRKLRA